MMKEINNIRQLTKEFMELRRIRLDAMKTDAETNTRGVVINWKKYETKNQRLGFRGQGLGVFF